MVLMISNDEIYKTEEICQLERCARCHTAPNSNRSLEIKVYCKDCVSKMRTTFININYNHKHEKDRVV